MTLAEKFERNRVLLFLQNSNLDKDELIYKLLTESEKTGTILANKICNGNNQETKNLLRITDRTLFRRKQKYMESSPNKQSYKYK